MGSHSFFLVSTRYIPLYSLHWEKVQQASFGSVPTRHLFCSCHSVAAYGMGHEWYFVCSTYRWCAFRSDYCIYGGTSSQRTIYCWKKATANSEKWGKASWLLLSSIVLLIIVKVGGVIMSSIDLVILGIVLEKPQSAYDIQKDVEYHHFSRWTK